MEIKSLKINGDLHEKLKGLSSSQKTSLQDMVEDKLYELVGREEDLLFDIKDITRNVDDSYNIVLDESSYRKLIHFFEVFITNRSLNNISEIQSLITVIQKLKVSKKDSSKVVEEIIEEIFGTRNVIDDGDDIEVVDIEDFDKKGRSVLKSIIENVNIEEINDELESLKEKAKSESSVDVNGQISLESYSIDAKGQISLNVDNNIKTLDENIDVEDFNKKSCSVLKSIIENSEISDKKDIKNDNGFDVVFKESYILDKDKREEELKYEFVKLGIEDLNPIKTVADRYSNKEILSTGVSYDEETINHIKNIIKFINNNDDTFLADIKSFRTFKEMCKKIVSNDHNYLCDLFFEDYKFFDFLLKEKCLGIRNSVEWYKDEFYTEQQFVIDDIKNIVIIVDAINDIETELYKLCSLYKEKLEDVYYLQSDLDKISKSIYKEFKKLKNLDIVDFNSKNLILDICIDGDVLNQGHAQISFVTKKAKDEFFVWFSVKMKKRFTDDEQINVEEFNVLNNIKLPINHGLYLIEQQIPSMGHKFYDDVDIDIFNENVIILGNKRFEQRDFMNEMDNQIELNMKSSFQENDIIYDILGNEYRLNVILNNIFYVTNDKGLQEDYNVKGFYKKFICGNKKYIDLDINFKKFIEIYQEYSNLCRNILNNLNLLHGDFYLPLAIRNLYKNNIILNRLFNKVEYDISDTSKIDNNIGLLRNKINFIRSINILLEKLL